MSNRTMLVEGLSLQNYDEFHVLLLFCRKAIVDVEKRVVLLIPSRSLSHVENEIACLQMQYFFPTAIVTRVD